MWQIELVDALNCNEDTAAVVEAYCRKTGKSARTIYRIAKKHGWQSGNSRRKDKGKLKSGITEGQISLIAALLDKTGRENKGPIMPVQTALEIAVDNGIIEPGQVSVETMQRLLREFQMSKDLMKAPTPHTELRSLHPNYCHLVDVSVCIQYYLKNGSLAIMDERDFYKNKPANFSKIKQKLLRYVLDDHFSGLFAFRYYVADGESRENLWDFLKWAWRDKGDSRLPFRGVPFFMLMDAGSAQTSHAMRNFFDGLGIERPKGKPYNPRRQGGVETVHQVIENNFETRLRISPAHSVEELNAWALDFQIHFHATRKHSRHKMTRLASWLLIEPQQLRELPEDDILNLIYAEPETECIVKGYRMTYRGADYNLKCIEGLPIRCKVKVRLNPYLWKTEQAINVVWDDQMYEVKAISKLPSEMGGFSETAAIIGQEYKALPETPIQKAKKQFNDMAFGTQEPKKGAVPFAGLTVFGHQADKVANLTTLPKRGTAIELSRPAAPVSYPIMRLFEGLIREGVKMTFELNRDLRAAFGDSIDARVMDEMISQIVETGTFTAPETNNQQAAAQ